MTMLWMDGFDAEDADVKYAVTSTNGMIPNLPAYGGGTGTRFNAGHCCTPANQGTGGALYGTGTIVMTKPITASSQVFLGAAIKAAYTPGGGPFTPAQGAPFFILGGDAGTTFHLFLVVNPNNAIELWRGNGTVMATPVSQFPPPNGTLLATSANNALPTAWHFVEMSATLNSSTGTAVVKVDGTTVISFTGNTKNGGTSSNIDTFAMVGMSAFVAGVAYFYVIPPSYDDLYILNSAGSVNNTFLGDMRVQTLVPTGAGTYTQLVPNGSASNWVAASQLPRNYPAYYNNSTAAAQQDTYALSHLVSTTGTVFALQQTSNVIKSDAGAASVKNVQKSGATVSYGATSIVAATMTSNIDMFEANPATSAAWTVAGVNALEAGAASA